MSSHYLGIDIGSSYTKIAVIDESRNILLQDVLKTLTRDKKALNVLLEDIHRKFNIGMICATGYGREKFREAAMTKTEIYCASAGVSELYPFEKNIIDIGGEDIKVIHSSAEGKVIDFYMNTKCAAGTGTFITEVAERAELDIKKMSTLAQQSTCDKELNSFCTVFAKTEIMQWIFDDIPEQDIARGIYTSIVNRIAKIRMKNDLPICLVGGVIAYHPFLQEAVQQKFGRPVSVPQSPQTVNAFGAAVLALRSAMKEVTIETKNKI